ncbi:MAG: hypothetical protein NTW78_10205 [Campylobacterales bacterium]|nr:hypothetical protein [Campylobacterales bacterium]
MIVSIFNKAKINIQNNWKSLSLMVVLWFILSQYAHLYKHILEASQLANCINGNEDIITPCKKLLELSGNLVFLFGLVTISILIFKEEKRETIIKILFVYYSAITVLYTTGIGYTDIEGQKLQLKLNQEYNIAKQESELLTLYKNNQEKKFENSLKIKELELSISNREIFYTVQQEEAKMYLQYKVTASYAIITLSYVLLLILLLQLNIDRLKIIGTLLILLFFAYPNY